MLRFKKKLINRVFQFVHFFEQFIALIKELISERQFIYLSCVLVGISSSFAVIFLKNFAHWVYQLSTHLNSLTRIPYTYIILPVLGILSTVYIIQKLLGGTLEKGTGQIMKSVASQSSQLPKKQMYAQILTSSLTVGMGGSAGLESPITITGAAFGSNYAKQFNLNYKNRTLLLACGVAAGISAAFNAPITGVLFAIEIILVDVSVSAFIPLMIAAATGTIISGIILKEDVLLSFKQQLTFEYSQIFLYIIFGIIIGAFTVYHSRLFRKVESSIEKISPNPYKKALIGASMLAGLFLLFPTLFGEGYESIKLLANDKSQEIFKTTLFNTLNQSQWIVLLFIITTAFVKSIATGLTLGSGGNGGNFAPSLFVGSYLGFVFSKTLTLIGLKNIPIENFTIVGMAGVLSGLFHAPLTAIFLIAEITGGYGLMLPLLIVSSISFAIAKRYEPYSMDIYNMVQKNTVFTDDKDQNILSKIKLNQCLTEINTINYKSSFAEVKDIFEVTHQMLIPVINDNHEYIGIINFHEVKKVIFNPIAIQHEKIINYINQQPSINIQSTAKFALTKMHELYTETLVITDKNKVMGIVNHQTIMNKYRTTLVEMRIE